MGIDECLLQTSKKLTEEFMFSSLEALLNFGILERRYSHQVYRKHQGLHVFRGLVWVACIGNDLLLDSGDMGKFKKRVDIINVNLPELKGVYGGRTILAE